MSQARKTALTPARKISVQGKNFKALLSPYLESFNGEIKKPIKQMNLLQAQRARSSLNTQKIITQEK